MGEYIGPALAVISAASSIAQGFAGASEADLERQQYDEERQNAELAARQDENARRQELERVLSTQEAIRAGRGVELFSATGLNIRANTIKTAEEDIATSRYNFARQARRFGLGSDAASARGTGSVLGGFGQAAGSVGQLFARPPTPTT